MGEATRLRRDPDALVTQVDPMLLSEAFDDAASDIEQHGWRRSGAAYPGERDPQGTYSRCVWVAILRALERRIGPINKLSLYAAAAENVLTVYFDVKLPIDLFELNDSFSGTDAEGTAWAIKSLREIQQQLLIGVRALELIAGPDFD